MDAVIEPYSKMSLVSKSTDDTSDSYFLYSLCNKNNKKECIISDEYYSFNEENSLHEVPCTSYDYYIIYVDEYNSNDELVSSTTGNAICLYVRREIQSLSSEDLESTMEAMYAIWSTSEEDGQEKYGSNFHNSTYFASAHDFNAAWVDSDHVHEGLGFIPQHVKLTNLVELAMQAYDPSVSMPYWDFTLEVAQGVPLNESIMFKKETFGTLTMPADTYWGFTYKDDDIAKARISDGRWADSLAEYNTAYPELGSSYGYMRGPWNTNPSPYVSRFATGTIELPSCSNYYDFLRDQLEYTDFLYEAAYAPHANVHGSIGSVYGCDKLDELHTKGLISDTDKQLTICRQWGFTMKELYRGHFIEMRDDCSYETTETLSSFTSSGYTTVNANTMTCGVVCTDDKYDEFPTKLKHYVDDTGTLTDEQMKDWRDFVCEGDAWKIFSGDHLESASPADPSFWPVHGTLERLLQVKFMVGGFPSTTWPTEASKDYVCDKSSCYEPSYGSEYNYYDECCQGHYENDQLLDFVSGDRYKGYGYTNKEILDMTNPTSYSMPYIYDNFQWDHCDDDFDELLDSLVDYSSNGWDTSLIKGYKLITTYNNEEIGNGVSYSDSDSDSDSDDTYWDLTATIVLLVLVIPAIAIFVYISYSRNNNKEDNKTILSDEHISNIEHNKEPSETQYLLSTTTTTI